MKRMAARAIRQTAPGGDPGRVLQASRAVLLLQRSAATLLDRLEDLERRLPGDDEATWIAYLETAKALAVILPTLTPGRNGELLSTREMAERIGISPKTLLRRKANGTIRPALVMGKRGRAAIRWRGDELVGGKRKGVA